MQPNLPVWDDGGWKGLPALDQDLTADVCVVGLGGSGLAAIREVRALGASVVGIDAGIVAGGAAGRNGGFLLAGIADFHHDAVDQHGREKAVALYHLTIDEIARMAAETPDAVRLTGSLRIAASEDEERDCRLQLQVMREDALPAEWYDGAEGTGLLIPTDGVYQPLRRCRSLARQAIGEGAQIFEHTTAIEIAGDEVRTPAARVKCEAVIVAIDGNLGRVLPELEPRIRNARLQMLATAPVSDMRLTRPVYTRWGYDYWQQLEDGRLVFGGFRDTAIEEEWTDSGEPTARVQSLQERFLRERLGVTAPITHRWAATVSYSVNGLPILEEVRRRVWAAGAYCGTGNVVGALCGRALGRLALGYPAPIAELLAG